MRDPLALIAEQRVLPVLRCLDPQDAVATARAAARGGLIAIELTHSIPDVHEAVAPLLEDGLVVGVGTLRRAEEVAEAASYGASFVVSFFSPDGFVAAARAAGIVAIPGGLTPSELAAARTAGADAVKLFPARLTSPVYLRDLAPLLPDLPVLVSGGVEPTPTALRPWLEAGAIAVGLGGSLGTAASVGEAEVERRCRAALAAARG